MEIESVYLDFVSTSGLEKVFSEHIRKTNTVGCDGISPILFEKRLAGEIEIIHKHLLNGIYAFSPYKAILKVRNQYKTPRKIEIPTVRDKIVLRIIYEILNSLYNEDLKNRLLHKQIKKLIETTRFTHVIRIDIQNYFPSIDHRLLLESTKSKLTFEAIRHLISYAIKNRSTLDPKSEKQRNVGIPQGLSISGILASIYLLDIDRYFESKSNIEYFRYVDDILVLCHKQDVNRIARSLNRRLRKKKLKINKDEKFYKQERGKPFDFLGYHFQGPDISVRNSSVSRLHSSIIAILSQGTKTGMAIEQIIFRLNLRITGCIFDGKKYGWMFYFSQLTDEQLLHRLDQFTKKYIKKILRNDYRVKKFVRTWHEINRNFSHTCYIPNFDTSQPERKKDIVQILGGDIQADIEIQYQRLLYKEIKNLERDMVRISQ